MSKGLTLALFAAFFAVVACSSSDKKAAKARNPAPCPNVIALNDAARLIEFDGDQTIDNVAYTAEIVNVSTGCRYFADKPIDADVDIELAFGKGPKGENGQKVFSYFVAVTRKGQEVIAKQNFSIPVDFSDKRVVVALSEEIDKINIPRATEQISGANFEIIVGFNLTPRQTIYNRSGKSLKFPDAK